MLANVTLIQPSKSLANPCCVLAFLLHRMENDYEANGKKKMTS